MADRSEDPGSVLRLDGEPDAVPRARRFARSALAASARELSDDVELVVAELMTNAVLHGAGPVTVSILAAPGCARVEVHDTGRNLPMRVLQRTDAMTGRGLSLVDALSARWGVEPTQEGKTVWAEITGLARPDTVGPEGGPAVEVGGVTDPEAILAAWSDDPEPRHRVYLGPVPTDLLVDAKGHIDNVVRELMLLQQGSQSTGEPLPAAVGALIETVTVDFAEVRAEIKRQALAAAARGDAVTDLELALPADAGAAAERYLAALDETDRYARSARLLTLAAPVDHRAFRNWYVASVAEQLRAIARGETPPTPQPLAAVLANEVKRLSQLEKVAARLEVLQQINASLAACSTAEGMAEAVVTAASEYPGVETARAYLLTDRATLRSVAWYSYDSVERNLYDEIPLDADLPGAEVARTRQPMVMNSLREVYARFPDMEGYYPDERSLHVVPVAVSDQTLGVLGLSFKGGELDQEAEAEFVNALAGALAQALERDRLARSDRETSQVASLLADATEVMVSTLEPAEVLRQLVRLAVPRLGDWCTVYLAEGGVLRRVAMAIDGQPELAEQLLTAPPLAYGDNPHTRACRTRAPQPVPTGMLDVLARIYPDVDFAALGADETSSGLVVPILLRGETLGVVFLAFIDSGRRFTLRVQDALVGLASRAAIALDNARNWAAQQQLVQSLVGALLPPLPPDLPGVEMAARYLPAGGDVAGDWWEADPMHDGSVLIGLGDAAGHGLDAVSLMLELRHGARALAAIDPSPSALLHDLNRRMAGLEGGFATAVYGRLDPASGRLRWAGAGHVPPLLIRADGRVETLRFVSGPALGSPHSLPGTDHELVLSPGDTLLLYSDGVVERRDESLEDGIGRLAATAAAHAGADLEQLADALVSVHCRLPLDDCCLLLIRRRPGTAP